MIGWEPCGLGPCAANDGHEGTCAEASGWADEPDRREYLHMRCDCVPDLGPAHCHLCAACGAAPVEWPCAPHKAEQVALLAEQAEHLRRFYA